VSKLRAAVIGAGYFGRLHAAKLAANPEVQLVAVVDLDAAREVLALPMFPQLDRERTGFVCEALRGAL
jgi:predicted dehydrogenase